MLTTELDVINQMLASVGLAPVATENSTHPSYRKAKLKLDQVNRDIQTKGAWYNRSQTTLNPTSDGQIYVPQYAVYVNPINPKDKLVIRGQRLYDTATRSYNIGRSVLVKLIEVLPFQELPEPAKNFISCSAIHRFYVDQGGQEPKLSEYRNERILANVAYKQEELRNAEVQVQSFRRTAPTNRFRGYGE